MAFKDRINELIAWLKISRAEFERRAGLSNGYTRNLGGVPGAEKLEAILRAFPEVSREWLLTGEGEMLKNSTEAGVNSVSDLVPDPAPSNDLALRLLALVESQQKTLADNAATIKRLSEEVAAQRLQIAALTEEGIRDVAEGVSPSSLQAVPSPVNSLV